MSGEEESLGPPIKPQSGEAIEGAEFPKSIRLEDGTEVPVGLPPGVDPEQAKLAVAYLQQNPTLAKNAVRHADRMVKTPGMAEQLAQMQQRMLASEEYQKRMALLRDDPELKPFFDEIAGQGMEAIDKYWNDLGLMSKISQRMEAMQLNTQKEKKKDVKIESLHDAAKDGDVETLKKFLQKGDVNAQDARGITPLGVAIGFNRLKAVECLLENGADVTLTDKQGNTVLHYAAGYGRVESADMLLACGADPNALNKSGKTPLDVAKINKEVATIEFLTKHLEKDPAEK